MNNQVNVMVNGAGSIEPCTYKSIILKKNIIGNQNLLVQAMIDAQGEDTKFIIKYDFTLGNVITGTAGVHTLSTFLNPGYEPSNGEPYYYYYDRKLLHIKAGQYVGIPKSCVLLNGSGAQVEFINGVAQTDIDVFICSSTEGDYAYNITNAVVMPKGCLIEFDGGSISDGVIVCNDTILIYYQPKEDVLKNVVLLGDYDINAGGANADKRDNTNGMGKIYLKKDKGFAEQLTQENTIYVMQYDFDLNDPNGEHPVTVPKNCVLEFDGGSVSNGTLVGSNTIINAGLVKIFSTDVVLEGTWNVTEAYPEWFGAVGDGVTVDTDAINKVMEYFGVILFSKVYVTRPVIFQSNRVVNFAPESKIYATDDYQDYEDLDNPTHPDPDWSPDCIFKIRGVNNVTINGNGAELSMLDYYHDDKLPDDNPRHYAYSQSRHCIEIVYSQDVNIYNLNCNKSGGDGFCLGWSSNGIDGTDYHHNENILLFGCGADGNKRQGISVIDGVNVLVEGCNLKNTFRAPGAGIDVESNLGSEQYYALRNINITNCYTEGNVEGVRITPQHYSDAVSISISHHTSFGDTAGLVFNRVGNGGGTYSVPVDHPNYGLAHPIAKGTITVEDYSIINPQYNGINLYNMFNSEIKLDVKKVFIKNVGMETVYDSSNRPINRHRSAIFMRDENYYNPVEGTYSGNYTISDITIDDDREITTDAYGNPINGCFAYIYGEFPGYEDVSLKNAIIKNIRGNAPYISNEPIIIKVNGDQPGTVTDLNRNLEPSVYFSITEYGPRMQKYVYSTLEINRGYGPIELYSYTKEPEPQGINYHLTTTYLLEQPFKFINNNASGRITFADNAHCLRYNNDVIQFIDCKPDAIGAEITVKYNGDYWEIAEIKGDWDIKSNKRGATNARPSSILSATYDIGFDYYDTSIKKKIFANSINSGTVVWVDDKGYTAALSKGPTSNRPALNPDPEVQDVLSTADAGFEYYDTDLGKPIYLKVEDSVKSWVDAAGEPVTDEEQ